MIFVALACSLAFAARSQTLSNDPVMNLALKQAAGMQSMADMVAGAVKSGAEVSNRMGDATARVRRARDRYWATYPNGPGFEAAKQEFDAALKSKDFFYLLGASTNTGGIMAFLGGQVDDGIPYGARKAFEAWVTEVMKNLMEGNASLIEAFSDTERARAQIIRADPHYRSYLVRRNFEEFRRQGKTPPNVDAEAWRISLVGLEIRQNPPPDPYTTAFGAVAGKKTFGSRCPAELSTILHKQLSAASCSCLREFVKGSLPYYSWRLETEFTAEEFLTASVAGAGNPDKVAACVRK
jgi:hypothetical protein